MDCYENKFTEGGKNRGSADFSPLVTRRDSRISKPFSPRADCPPPPPSRLYSRGKEEEKKEGEEGCKRRTNPFPPDPDRSIFFIFHTAKNFSIFATLPSGCYRVSIFHFVGAESSDRGDAAQITSTPANKEEKGREERERKREKEK